MTTLGILSADDPLRATRVKQSKGENYAPYGNASFSWPLEKSHAKWKDPDSAFSIGSVRSQQGTCYSL